MPDRRFGGRGVTKATARVEAMYDAQQPWRERTGALVALLAFFESKPATAHLLVVESYVAGREADLLRARVLDEIVAVMDGGSREAKSASGLSPLTAEGTVGAALFVIHRRMTAAERGAEDDLPAGWLMEFLNPLMSLIVLPYFGGAAARAELKRAAVVPHPARQPGGSLSGLDIRLTYRTMRVLSAIAARPGSSNREVGRAADPGQISKLLTRLQQLGLIENTQAGGPKGMPNAWVLTPKGAEVECAIAPCTPARSAAGPPVPGHGPHTASPRSVGTRENSLSVCGRGDTETAYAHTHN